MPADQNRAIFEVLIRGRIEEVWKELTRTDRPQRAIFNSVLHTDRVGVGGQVRMRTPSGKYTGVVGRYLEVDEPNLLVHTMRFTSSDDPECTIRYSLAEVAEGVRLRLVVDDLPLGTKSEKNLRQGGAFIARNLKAIIETGRPTLGALLLFLMFRLMEPFSPKRSRSELWPIES
ncbi:MAG: SRPBCC domain-containing protein [Acidobacteriota bacterium]